MPHTRYIVVQHKDEWLIKFGDGEYGPYHSRAEAMLFAIDGLVGGSNPLGPTTQSRATGDFLKVYERPRIGGDLCDGSFSETASLPSAGLSCAFFSGPEIPFPGNGDRERQRLGSNAGYAEGSPSIWCCRDHSAGMSARRATPMP